jgi:hypothetical protein
MLSVSDDARLDVTGHDDDATGEPEALEAYAARDPRAGHGIAEHDVGWTFLAKGATDKCWNVAFTLTEMAGIIRSNVEVGGIRLTALALSNAETFSGIVAACRGGAIGPIEAAGILQAKRVRGIVYLPVDEDGWRVLIPLSQPRAVREIEPLGSGEKERPPRYIEVFESFAARISGLFGGKLEPTLFEPGFAVSIGGVRDLKVIDGEFLDRNDRTYSSSIFRDGATITSRAAASKAREKAQAKPEPTESVETTTLSFTELTPDYKVHAGKTIGKKGRLSEYPKVKFWHQRVVEIPARIEAHANYLQDARTTRNVVIIRGKPANPACETTLRQIAYIKDEKGDDRGDHGFEEQSSRALFLDVDKALVNWRGDSEGAIRWIRDHLGEPFKSASCAWLYTGTHGLETETIDTGRVDKDGKPITYKRWTGNLIDGVVRTRLAFITDRPISGAEVAALTQMAQDAYATITVDPCIVNLVQPNYIRRMLWEAHPNRDPLGDIATAGVVEGASEYLVVPAGLALKARWQAAQGHGGQVASHPSAEAAVAAIGTDGHIRHHLTAAIGHLANSNPLPAGATTISHAATLADELACMVRAQEDVIRSNLATRGRNFAEVLSNFPKGMTAYAVWKIPRAAVKGRRTIKLVHQARDDQATKTRAEIIARVRVTVHEMAGGVTLLIAPTGTYKSTELRQAAVGYVRANPGRTVVLLVPTHELGEEQLRKLHEEHPEGDFTAKIWRGRFRVDPEFVGPIPADAEPKQMCWRADVGKPVEDHLVNVNHLCARGRGERKARCEFFECCGWQRQSAAKPDIWIAAHELVTHEMPKAFGDVGRIFIDETPTDAFLFGTNGNVAIALKQMIEAPDSMKRGRARDQLMEGRRQLHGVLSDMAMPEDEFGSAPVANDLLDDLLGSSVEPIEEDEGGTDVVATPAGAPKGWEPDVWEKFVAGLGAAVNAVKRAKSNFAGAMTRLEWMAKVDPPIHPHMNNREIEKLLGQASGNSEVRKFVLLWQQLGSPGRVQRTRPCCVTSGRI